MSVKKCVVCEELCWNTCTYETKHGDVCEYCYESRKGTKSEYDKWVEENK